MNMSRMCGIFVLELRRLQQIPFYVTKVPNRNLGGDCPAIPDHDPRFELRLPSITGFPY